MKAAVCPRYGPPDVLQIADVPKPTPQDNEVLVRIHATTVTSGDRRVRAFDVPRMFWLPGRLMLGWSKPKQPILGSELAGEVEAVGKDVTRFAVGDRVVGFNGHELGANAEYHCLPEDGVIEKIPDDLAYTDAAALPFGGGTALKFLREGDIQAGQRVLVYGASGAVGTYAVQLARYFGADVTGVCSTANLELVQSLGANRVIDYTREDFARNGETYDIIFDAVGKTTFGQCNASLEQTGVYLQAVMIFPEIEVPWIRLTSGKKAVGGNPDGGPDVLTFLVERVANGDIKPVVDRCYPLDDIVTAHRYVDTGRKRGVVALTV